MELNTKISIEVRYNKEEDKNKAEIKTSLDLSLNELLTSLELAEKAAVDILTEYIKNKKGGKIKEEEVKELIEKPIRELL